MSHYKPGMSAKDIIASVEASRRGIVLPFAPKMEPMAPTEMDTLKDREARRVEELNKHKAIDRYIQHKQNVAELKRRMESELLEIKGLEERNARYIQFRQEVAELERIYEIKERERKMK